MRLAVALAVVALLGAGCTRRVVFRTIPEDAVVTVNGKKVEGNSFEYDGRVGAEYRLRVEAPGYFPEDRRLDVHLPTGADGSHPVSWVTGELPTQMHIELRPLTGRLPGEAAKKLRFEEAVREVAENLLAEIRRERTREHKGWRAQIVLDPVVDPDTGRAFEISQKIEDLINDEARLKFPSFNVAPMRSQNIDSADYVLTGIMPLEKPDAGSGTLRHLLLSVVDRKSGEIAFHADVWILDTDLDVRPTAFYRESILYLKDQRTDALVATARAPIGSLADPSYLNSLSSTALINEAVFAYNAGDYERALSLFSRAVDHPDGAAMIAYSGIVQSLFKLGRTRDAGPYVAAGIALGLEYGKIELEPFFEVNTTHLFGAPPILELYEMHLHAIASNIATSTRCVRIVGHASPTGTQQRNQELSEERAVFVYQKLRAEAPGVEGKTSHEGRGHSEPRKGTKTNDAEDAVDRRVEFQVVQCSLQ